jgi:phosphoglycolate phosphatase
MAAPTVVFDLDGTLVDTAPDLVATLNVIFAREGLPPVAYDAARNMVGGGARLMIERGLAAEDRKLAASEVDRLVRDFIDYYAAHIADHSRPFPGLMAALDELGTRGCRFAVCTNKLEWLSVRLLDALGLSERFVAICGADTFGIQKPNPELLRRTIVRAGGQMDAAVMVGDSISDIATARAAGTPVIAVDYGYTETPVGELGPDRVIGALGDLPGMVFELLGRGIHEPKGTSIARISPYRRHT